MKKPFFFYYPTISNLMTTKRYEILTKCLHQTNMASYIGDPTLLSYNKMCQVRPMIEIMS